VTEHIQIRAGSVVAPLHNPLRVAEEWAVVDNLSGGRAGVSFASGWHARDFALNPSQYENRRSALFERMDDVRRLWRGESIAAVDGSGKATTLGTFPRPIQAELPVWITSGGDIDTFRAAGRAGAGLLTHLLGQDLDRLAAKIAEYRREAAGAGIDGWNGHVVLMVHTFVGEDDDAIKDAVREPMSAYMRSSLGLILGSKGAGGDAISPDEMDPEDIDFLVDRAFDRYFDHEGMLGSVDKVRKVVARIGELGVDEVACLIDFGLPTDQVLDGLVHLNEVRRLCG
jgi:natural product biosynthesis luciferase-like monooxygenase protein